MKKLFIVLIAALVALTALAEGTGFTFRGDITWGMTQAKVLEAEGNPKHETDHDDDTGMDELEIEDVIFEGAPCDIEYGFLSDSLRRIKVAFDDDKPVLTFNQLKSSLSLKYGEGTSDGSTALLDDPDEIGSAAFWTLNDGTVIILTEDAEDGDLEILYAGPEQ